MRHGIYYWKCDCPRPDSERRDAFAAGKYDTAGVEPAARAACREVLGQDAETVSPMRCAGDHFAYRVRCDGRDLLFRAAADATGDDYMLAEDAAMAAARAVGVPVPRVLRTAAAPGSGLRWQLMELVPGATLRDLAIDRAAIAADLGRILRRLHTVGAEGYGFIDTSRLRAGGGMRGLDASYAAYATCRLRDHLAYAAGCGLLDAGGAARVDALLQRHRGILDLARGVLVHRDPAPWNLVGTASAINALIDWDDVVIGDPADDLAILRCLHDRSYTGAVESAYWGGDAPPPDFELRVRWHMLRNMLWKAQIRHQLGYFRRGSADFIAAACGAADVEAATRAKLAEATALLEEA